MEKYDWILSVFNEGVTIYTVIVCFACIVFMGYVVHLGSKAKRFILKTRWLGLEVIIENSTTNSEKNTAIPLNEPVERKEDVEQ